MKSFSLSGWKLLASLVIAFILGVAAMIGFAFMVGDGDSTNTANSSNAQGLSDIQRQFESTPSALPSDGVFNDGIYKVGTDIQPGTYKNEGTESCYCCLLYTSDAADE